MICYSGLAEQCTRWIVADVVGRSQGGHLARISPMAYLAEMALSWSLDIPRFGDAELASKWLQHQIAKCDDKAFGRRFADSCPVSGLKAEDYRHRMIEAAGFTNFDRRQSSVRTETDH